MIWVGVPAQIAAVAEVEPVDAGAASAIITTIADSHVSSLAHHESMSLALTGGFHLGLREPP